MINAIKQFVSEQTFVKEPQKHSVSEETKASRSELVIITIRIFKKVQFEFGTASKFTYCRLAAVGFGEHLNPVCEYYNFVPGSIV